MAHGKRSAKNEALKKYKREILEFVTDLYKHNGIPIAYSNDFYTEWFGYTRTGYMCAVTCKNYYSDLYLIIRKNTSTNEIVCDVLKRYEHIVKPSNDPAILLNNVLDRDSLI